VKTEDRLPPHDEGTEAAFLGCLLIAHREDLLEALTVSKATVGAFYDLRHQDVFRAIEELADAGKAVEPITVCEKLKRHGHLDDAGGEVYVGSLPDKTPSPANWPTYWDTLRDLQLKRAVVSAGLKITQAGFDQAGQEAKATAERELAAVALDGEQDRDTSIKTAILGAVDDMEELRRGQGTLGLQTGLENLDAVLRGMRPGQLIVLAARPGCGKTTLALNIAEHVAVTQRLPVGFFSLEMTRRELAFRLLLSRARVTIDQATAEKPLDATQKALVVASGHVAKAPLHIEDQGGLSIAQLRSHARRMAIRHKPALLVVDYLQLLNGTGRRENRCAEITEISGSLKALAKELHLPILALSQLNRASEQADNRKPRLSDLRDSGSIEQDADAVLFIWSKEQQDADLLRCKLTVAKHRNGPLRELDMIFNKPVFRFTPSK
jgi:replicative DNA helicase